MYLKQKNMKVLKKMKCNYNSDNKHENKKCNQNFNEHFENKM